MKAPAAFHAHVYFEAPQRPLAVRLRAEIERGFPVAVGRVHDTRIGPHGRPMFQVRFSGDTFGALVPWLMQHRQGLSVLIHADTGDDYRDHTQHAMWLGETVPLELSVFDRAAEGLNPP